MAELTWRRTELEPGNPGIGDAAAQLFEGRKQMRLEIFVREDLQNRVDARRDGSTDPVQVQITLKPLPAILIRKYFPADFQEWYRRTETQNMNAGEKARRVEEIDRTFASSEFPVLVIEDFGSTGLNGPVNSKIPEKNRDSTLFHTTNAFTCFFRRNGTSGKTDKKLGSAGLGRHVYYKASQISTKLVYTIPIDLCRKDGETLLPLEPRPLFFGQSFQRELVERDGNLERSYCSYYFLSGPDDAQKLPMPLGLGAGEDEIVKQACRDFRLARRPDQPGCSVIIPFPRSNFTTEELINSIVRDFPMPILSGDLMVEVDGKPISAANVASLSDKREINSHNAFLSEALQAHADVTVAVSVERLKDGYLATDLFSAADLKNLASNYRDRSLVCVKVDIRFGSRQEQHGSVLIAVRKTADGHKGRHLVARSGLVLSEYSKGGFNKASNAIVRVLPDELGSLLRSAENPAHSEWLPGDIDMHRCACAAELILFIRTAHAALDRMLTNLDTEDDLNIFRDLLPAGGRKSNEPKDSPFDIELESDGQTFVLNPAEHYDADPGTRWRLSLIYDSIFGSGRARKGYRPGTFDLQSVAVDVKGGKVIKKGACHLDITVNDPQRFRMKFGPCGFAGWADVRFHADRHSPATGDHS